MKNSARYVVTTHWGTFSLDEGSYQDYLLGNLWICWEPGKTVRRTIPSDCVPVNVTEQAMALREQAEKAGIIETLQSINVHEAIVPYSMRFADLSIDEMSLTVRSSNGLKRANILTLGKLKERMSVEGGLINIRNIGQKSLKEIKRMFFEECYDRLTPYEKAAYWQEILEKKNIN